MLKFEKIKAQKSFPFWWYWKEKTKGWIAICLYKLGFIPKCTLFIDDVTYIYGYEKISGNSDMWRFTLPFKYVIKHNIKTKNYESSRLFN